MDYRLTTEQEERFEYLYNKYQDKIKLVLYKTNISPNNYAHFYSHALEGFLQSFLIMEAGDLSEKDFPAFAYTNMKRRIIDELRRFSRNKDFPINIEENYANMAFKDSGLEECIIKNSIVETLSKKEVRVFKYLIEGYSYKEISEIENISKSTYYNVVSSIKSKSKDLLYK